MGVFNFYVFHYTVPKEEHDWGVVQKIYIAYCAETDVKQILPMIIIKDFS